MCVTKRHEMNAVREACFAEAPASSAPPPPPPPLHSCIDTPTESPWSTARVLLECVCAGLSEPLVDAAALCRLSQTCSEARQFAKERRAYWTCLDLSHLPRPTLFFEEGLSRVPRFAGVIVLTLQFCEHLRDEHLAVLPPAVRRLTIDGCAGVTDAGIKAVSSACGKSLELISLYCCHRLSTSSAVALSIRCPSLTAVSFSGCKRVEAAGILALASRCRLLRELNLTRLPLVDDMALGVLVDHNPELRALRLYSNSQLSDASLRAVAQRCAQLHTLDCTGLRGLSDALVVALGHGCPELRVLLLTWVVHATDRGGCAIASGCRRLRTLSLHGIKAIGAATLEALALHCAATLVELDVRGCVNIVEAERAPEGLLRRLPRLKTFALAT